MSSTYSGQRLNKSFYSNGKLLLTGEYTVLDGALSLALPTSFGQSLSIETIDLQELRWKSLDEKGNIWFDATFKLSPSESDNGCLPFVSKTEEIEILANGDKSVSKTLLNILREAKKLNPGFLQDVKGYAIETKLTFPRDWGLGSSSTLINNIAQWAKVDAHQLLWNSFSGSGYDIACAQNDHPISYRLVDKKPLIKTLDFNPTFKDRLYFIHLNEKQNSREGIASYRDKIFDKTKLIKRVSVITSKSIVSKNIQEFEALMTEHEALISNTLQMPTVKASLFPNFKGAIKSLGAWGGDFIMATGDEATPSYFEALGYGTIVPYAKMILRPSK